MTTPLEILEQGIEQWNRWRSRQSAVPCSLAGKDLSHGYFFEGDFRNVDLSGANLCRACFVGADFRGANLSSANFNGAYLADANFQGANLKNTDFSKAQLDRADMRSANLVGTVLDDADISAARLPDPDRDWYVDEVALLLAQRKDEMSVETSDQGMVRQLAKRSLEKFDHKKSAVNVNRRAVNHQLRSLSIKSRPAKSSALKQTSDSLGGWIGGKDRRKGEADRRQSIRLSTFALPGKKGEPSSVPWGRRREDKERAAELQLNQSAGRRRRWRPAAVMAVVAIALGLPLTVRQVWSSVQSESVQSTVDSDEALETTLVSAVEATDRLANHSVDRSADRSLVLANSLTGGSEIKAIATYTLPDSTARVVTGTVSGQVEIWDGQTGERLSVLTGHAESVSALTVGDGGRWLVSGGPDGLSVWQPETGELIHHIPQFDSGVAAVAIAPNSNTFVSSDRVGNVSAWDLTSGEQLYQVDSGSAVWSVAIAPDGQSFITGSSDAAIYQWDMATGERLTTFAGHQDAVRSVAMSADGQTLVSGSVDKTIKLWDVATGNVQMTLRDSEPVFSIAMSADGQTLASSSADQTIKLWDLSGGYLSGEQVSQTLDDEGDVDIAIAFDAEEFALVSGGKGNTVSVWRQNL